MSRYKAYAEYKDSGVEWLGPIPIHWEILQSRRMFAVRSEPALSSDKMLTASQKYGVLYQSDFVEKEGRRVAEVILGVENLKHVEPNDFIISMRSFQGGIEWCTLRGATSFHYVMLKPLKNVVPRFFAHLFKSLSYIHALRRTSDLIRDGQELRFSNFVLVSLPLIPDDEQEKIADFLDHETAKIDALIEKQQRLIELLKEKRQAVISHAVTKGLNPNAPMKDSSVEWADRVPAHWRVSKLGYHASVSNGATPNRENMLFWENGTIGWLNSSKVNDEVIKEADQFITKFALSKTSVKPVHEGDLVMAITGEGQTRGRVAICNIEATINQHLAAISIRDKLLQHEFLYLWLEGNYERIRYESEGAGSTKGAITCSEISAFPVILPPLEEQDQIVSYVAERKYKFDGLIGKAISAIELMQERRTALISAAVTGKIDVRDWQAAD